MQLFGNIRVVTRIILSMEMLSNGPSELRPILDPPMSARRFSYQIKSGRSLARHQTFTCHKLCRIGCKSIQS